MQGKNTNSDDQLKIVVRQREYNVSKKFICSSVPYFEKMFCCDLLESKTNKVELDFDERAFDAILNWIHSESFTIQMDYVISLYDAADYLMINEGLLESCFSYFHENFTIEHISIVLPQVTKVSKLINSADIENFICRYFLMITNTDIFLDYSVETVEAILKLDLMVHSEYQILNAILKWVNKDIDCRKESLERLLNCVRWYLIDAIDKKLILNRLNDKVYLVENSFPWFLSYFISWPFMDLGYLSEAKLDELKKTQSSISSNNECRYYRGKQRFFISIRQKDDKSWLIHMFDDELCCLPIGDFTRDNSMTFEFVHGEHISDILFGSASRVRINWISKKLKFAYDHPLDSYYRQLIKLTVKFSPSLSSICYNLENEHTYGKPANLLDIGEKQIIEYDGTFICIIRYDNKFIMPPIGSQWYGIFPVLDPIWFQSNRGNQNYSFQATVLDDTVYILTKELKFIQFNMITRSFNESKLLNIDFGYNFDDLILTSHAKNDVKVILVNKSSGKVYFYHLTEKKWIYKCKIIKAKDSSDIWSNKLIAFTSMVLPIKILKPLYGRENLAL